VNELLAGHPISEKDLREVLGHTWLEVIGGILLGLLVATISWMIIR
jgi:acid phosphatase family membrane protein YuiD